ncbi:hypothetical protein AYI69_g7501 [Smittium culicis]|uniref:Uncharacterized protein n=1 Tax=Smittium culicis TaxID=133412 RepID=A0A1R1XRS8_9FUNG|nr:hypothetical protein AYI69_g7501 [Smittium culicis]
MNHDTQHECEPFCPGSLSLHSEFGTPQQSHQQRPSSYTSGSAYKGVIGPAIYEEIREGGRSELARATKTLEEETSTGGNHQVIVSYAEILSRKRKCRTDVDEGARHKIPKHDLSVVIRSLVHHITRKYINSNSKHAVKASENKDEGRANRKRSKPYVFIDNDVEFIKKRKLELVRETGAKTRTMICSDPESISSCGMIDEGQRLEYFEMLRRLHPKVVMVQETLVKWEDWAFSIPGYEVFHDCAREGSIHVVLLGISKGHVAQRIPGIEGKLVISQAQLDEQNIKFGSLYLPCISATERTSTKGKLLELLLT